MNARFTARLAARLGALLLAPSLSWAQAGHDLLTDTVAQPGSAALGGLLLGGPAPYRGEARQRGLLPLYLYEGERVFLRGERIGLKWLPAADQRVELFLRRRLEGHPPEDRPAVLDGMAPRGDGADLGLSYRLRLGAGDLQLTLLQDISETSRGSELGLAYGWSLRGPRWQLRPGLGLAWRSARLNDFYFGVRDAEARPERAVYRAGSGVDAWAGLYGSYQLTENWQLLGGLQLKRAARTLRNSPLVDGERRGAQPTWYAGAAYQFGSGQGLAATGERSPLIVRALYGAAAEDRCHLVKLLTLRCIRLNDEEPTQMLGLQLGKTFVEGFNGWPLDFVGYAGITQHRDRPFQRNAEQLDLFMKAYWYGLPWSGRVKTRLGWGLGVSIANRVPYQERVSLEQRGRQTSKVLNYLDPSVEISLGDLIDRPALRDSYIGLGISHRSGIFGSTALLGRVNGGSNYIYASFETRY